MKRLNNLFEQICNLDNLKLADKKARLKKSKQYGVIEHDKNKEENIYNLHKLLISGKYKTSKYFIFKIFEPKEREIYKLPYYPDRIVHHAIMNILQPIFVNTFISTTYNCIKKRGISAAYKGVNLALRNIKETTYCLKLDIKKFYPSIDNNILKLLLRRKFKDVRLLTLLDEIIDSTVGLPIGNYLSQYLANFYLTYFDHYLKEVLKVKYYFRYCDDIVILHESKVHLHYIFNKIQVYLKDKLNLSIKTNYQIFPTRIRGIDFVGYRFFGKYILLRKTIKQKFIKMILYNNNLKSINSYYGWLLHCNSKNLQHKYLNYEQIRSY